MRTAFLHMVGTQRQRHLSRTGKLRLLAAELETHRRNEEVQSDWERGLDGMIERQVRNTDAKPE